jgi:hypothetical protein
MGSGLDADLGDNISRIQRQLLQDWRMPIRHIGYEIGRKGMKDNGNENYARTIRG